jgi:hypothetical protein
MSNYSYKKIAMTSPHINEWEIEAFQIRYKNMNGIDLTKDQVEKAFLF